MVQVERPTVFAVDPFLDGLPARPVPVDVALLKLDPRPIGALGHEADLDLAGVLGLVLSPSR
jgi:hypothetical protein